MHKHKMISPLAKGLGYGSWNGFGLAGWFLVMVMAAFLSGCFFGFENTQEPRNNPLDPLYHSQEGRMILGEPQKVSASTIRVYWKPAEGSGFSLGDWSYTVYTFTSNLETVVDILNDYGDPTNELTELSPQPSMNGTADAESRYFEDSPSSKTYYVVKFYQSGGNVNFSNIVVYTP